MKKIVIALILCLFLATGCLKKDSFDNITIYTTAYPFKFVAQELYGEHSEVLSIYPANTDIENYVLTDKQIEIYGKKAKLYIFNGLNREKDYVIPMVKHNNGLKIINATLTMDYENSETELWLSPANLLMISQNIKNGLNEYISNYYLKEEINNNYENLKINLSNLDAKLRLISTNADSNKLIVSSDIFKFLETYNFELYIVNKDSDKKVIEDAKTLVKNKEVSYVFLLKGEEISTEIASLISNTDVKVVYLHPLSNLTEEEEKNKNDYLTIMNENIELIKEEVYN